MICVSSPISSSCFCFSKYDSLHRTTGDERSPLLPTVFVVFELVCLFFSFPHWMMVIKYTHTELPHTYIQTLGTEQYRGDFEVFCAGQHAKVPSERSHRQYTAEVGWLVRWFCWRPRNVWPDSVHFEYWTVDPTMHCKSSSRDNTDLRSFHDNWQSERGFQGLGYKSRCHRSRKWNVKKRRVTLWQPTVIFGSSVTSVPIFFFDTIFKCAFTCTVHIWQSEDTCWCVRSSWSFLQTPNKCPSWRIRRITLKPKPPQVTTSSPVLLQCVTGLLFSASLLPCSASRSDSSGQT